MRRTIYKDNVVIDESMLNNTENSKIAEILLHHKAIGQEGVLSGLSVSVSAENAINISVSPGKAVLPNREIVELIDDQLNISLATNALNQYNLVLLSYFEESTSLKADKLGREGHLALRNSSGYISVVSVDQYFALPQSDNNPITQTRDNSLVIAIVTGNGEDTALLSTSIKQSTSFSELTDFGSFKVLSGIVIKSTSIASSVSPGYLKFDLANRRLRFISPNNPSPPELEDLGEEAITIEPTTPPELSVLSPQEQALLLSGETQLDLTLSDPDVPEDFIVVDIFFPVFPEAIESLDINDLPQLIRDDIILPIFTNPTTNINLNTLSSTQLSALIENDTFNNFIINEEVSFVNLYSENSTQIQENIDIEVSRAGAVDSIHRQIIGSGQTTENNPHGIALRDVIQAFDKIAGAFRVGDSLLQTAEDALNPRITSKASTSNKYTLLFEFGHSDDSSDYANPTRIYINSSNGGENTFAGLTITVNAKYNPGTNYWEKDEINVNAVRFLIDYQSVGFYINSSSPTIFDPSDWNAAIYETDINSTQLAKSLGIVPKSNTLQNSATINTGLINTSQPLELFNLLSNTELSEALAEARPLKVLLFENRRTSYGSLRIYLGKDQSDISLTKEVETGQVDEFNQPIIDTIELPNNEIDFVVNAKPVLGSLGWLKDVSSQRSYLFRYKFATASIEAYRLDDNVENFQDGDWIPAKINLKGGVKATEDSIIVANYIVDVDGLGIVYESPGVIRKKIVSVKEIGWNVQSGGLGHGLPSRVSFTNIKNYIDVGDFRGTVDRPVPTRMMYENITKNRERINTTRLVWTGPNTAFDRYDSSDGEQLIPVPAKFDNNATHRYLFPLIFEEETVELIDLKIPLDIDIDYDQFEFPINLQFNDNLDTQEKLFNCNFWDTDIISGSNTLVSPLNNNTVKLTYEDVISGSENKMIWIRSETLNEPFLTITRTDLNRIVYFHMTSIIDTWTGFNESRDPFPNSSIQTAYGWWYIGSPIIKYRTRNVE